MPLSTEHSQSPYFISKLGVRLVRLLAARSHNPLRQLSSRVRLRILSKPDRRRPVTSRSAPAIVESMSVAPFNNHRFGSPMGSPYINEPTLSDSSTYGGYGGYNGGYNNGYNSGMYGDNMYGDSMYGAGHGYFGRPGGYHLRNSYLSGPYGGAYDDWFDDGSYSGRFYDPYISYRYISPYRRRRHSYYRSRREPFCVVI